jgi:outer membrane protein assembly factor BamB
MALCGCSGGGGGTTTAPQPAWEKFRHDVNNTGQGSGAVANSTVPKGAVLIDATAIVSSPAVALDGTVYVGSTGGTLAAINPNDLSKPRWTQTDCGACGGKRPLGPIFSSPAVYTFNGQTSIMIGSSASNDQDGGVFVFQDTGNSQPACVGCFIPEKLPQDSAAVSFLSSPTFTINTVNPDVNDRPIGGIFIGGDNGTFYAINADGTPKWQYPRFPTTHIGSITSSAAFGQGDTLYFTAADDNLYALRTTDGTLKWTFPLPTASAAAFGATPVTSVLIYAATGDGDVLGINPDGTFAFRAPPVPGDPILAALALGNLAATAVPTASPTPTGTVASPTPTETATPPFGGTLTPTPTATPLSSDLRLFAITRSGQVIVIPVAAPVATLLPTGSTPIPTPVLSSPALSGDGFLVFGGSDGKLYALNNVTGQPPSTSWPVQLTEPVTPALGIQSSPAIDANGTIYVGADDGKLYVIGPS